MRSTKFETEVDYDYVTIGETKYSGTIEIDTILPSNFTVEFHSNSVGTVEGFMLNWNCIET